MPIQLPPEIIKEIAEQLDCGMNCYYHTKTGELESYPDQMTDEEMWQDVIDKIDENYFDYLRFDVLKSYESCAIMERFVDEKTIGKLREMLANAIGQRKPFQNFRNVLDRYPDALQAWYAYKAESFREHVQEIVDEYNRSQELE